VAKDKEATSPVGSADPKLKAFSEAVAALAPLDRVSRLDVLRAAANFYGLVVVTELPK